MCGRYSFAKDLSELAALIDFICRAPFFAPRYNIAPRQQAPVIVRAKGQTEAKLMRWGLIPSWSKDEICAWLPVNSDCSPHRCAFVNRGTKIISH